MAGTSINIGGGDDQFNRYKMPPVLGKVEGRGNGIKTRIVNCTEVARALHRPPGYVCKFFGCELGAQTKIDDTDGVYIVNGSFPQNFLMDTLNKFIEMFVICKSCRLPETDLKLRKNGDITQACNACGAENLVDMSHKLCAFIKNNPPDGKNQKKGSGKKDKASRRAAKAKKANGVEEDAGVDGAGDKKERKKDSKKTAKRTVDDDGVGMVGDFDGEYAGDVMFGNGVDDDDGDVQWTTDTSKEAAEARQKDLGAAASILERAPVEEERDMAMKLRAYIDDGKKPSKVFNKALKIYGEEDFIRGIMMAATFDETLATVVSSVRSRVLEVFQFMGGGKPMTEEAQQALLAYMDWVGENDQKLVQILPHFLKLFFEGDVLEEEKILKWYNVANGCQNVRDAVRDVVNWIESDDDDDDDESEEEESDDE